jgi:hypothetical protein
MNTVDKYVEEIKKAKTDDEIKKVLAKVYMDTQYCSNVRKELDQFVSE